MYGEDSKKTFLLNQFFDNGFAFKVTGIFNYKLFTHFYLIGRMSSFSIFINIAYRLPKKLKYGDKLGFQRARRTGNGS